jgi:hypothetical protein
MELNGVGSPPSYCIVDALGVSFKFGVDGLVLFFQFVSDVL